MKNISLIEQYKLSLFLISIVLPIISVFFIIVGVISSINSNIYFLLLVFIGLSAMNMLILVILRKYLKKEIDELTNNNEQ